MKLAFALLLTMAPGSVLTPDRPEARQVAIFEGLRPYFKCIRSEIGPVVPASPVDDLAATFRVRASNAEKACDPALKAAMKRLGIFQPTPAALGEHIDRVRWRKLNSLQQTYRSMLVQEVWDAYYPDRPMPQSGSPYAATEILLPYFSCFEDAFRRHPGAFSRDHRRIAAARKDSETGCAPQRTALRRMAGVPIEDAAPHARPGPYWRVQRTLSGFQDGIVAYQLELNHAMPAPLPPPGPPDPRPREHAQD